MSASPSSLPAWRAQIVSCTLGVPTKHEIRVRLPTGEKDVVRNYKDFERLNAGLGQLVDPLPQLPGKAGPSLLRSNYRNVRREGLQTFLDAVAERFPRAEHDALATFLGASADDRVALQQSHSGTAQYVTECFPSASRDALPESVLTNSASMEVDEPPKAEMGSPSAARISVGADAVPGSQLEQIRQVRHEQFLAGQAAQRAATTAASSSASPPPTSGTGGANSALEAPSSDLVQEGTGGTRTPPSGGSEPPERLSRLAILPVQPLPEAVDGERERMGLLREALAEHRSAGTVLEQGTLLQGQDGHQFTVVRCTPSRGIIAEDTMFFLDGPCLPVLKKVQFTGLVKREPGVTGQTLFAQSIAPHFRSRFADRSRVAIATLGDTPAYGGVRCHVAAVEPDTQGLGIVDRNTEIFTQLDDADEFARIHVVPFMDTLPSAYDYSIFQDYVCPFFDSHRVDRFAVGETIIQAGVQFKVVATEPSSGSRRVGRTTQIYCEGRLHPTVADLLSTEHQRLLAVFPPGIQLLLLQTDLFGNGDTAERIMTAQAMQSNNRPTGVTATTLDRVTEVAEWSELKERLSLEQCQCVVCLGDFEDGDEVRALPCKHVFHTACIDEWLGRDVHCPLCRTGLVDRGSRRSRGIF